MRRLLCSGSPSGRRLLPAALTRAVELSGLSLCLCINGGCLARRLGCAFRPLSEAVGRLSPPPPFPDYDDAGYEYDDDDAGPDVVFVSSFLTG
jgi:hypothetical protein